MADRSRSADGPELRRILMLRSAIERIGLLAFGDYDLARIRLECKEALAADEKLHPPGAPRYEDHAPRISKVFESKDSHRDLSELKRLMFTDRPWVEGCEIVENYWPPHPPEGYRPRVVIRYKAGEEYAYLRHSLGPLQGYGWDIYGDDFQSVALATLALSQAPPPRNVDPIRVIIPSRSADAE